MFRDEDIVFEAQIRALLEYYGDDLDRLFDELDITVESVLSILLQGGHVETPQFILNNIPKSFDNIEEFDIDE